MNMETIRLWIHRDGSQSRRNITADARTVLIGKDNRCNGNVLPGYGKTLSAMKAFPTDSYADAENGAPYIEYSIVTKQAGDYEAEFICAVESCDNREPIAVCSVRERCSMRFWMPLRMILRSEIISLCGRAVCWIRSGAGVYRCNWNRESIRSGSIRSRRALFLRRS